MFMNQQTKLRHISSVRCEIRVSLSLNKSTIKQLDENQWAHFIIYWTIFGSVRLAHSDQRSHFIDHINIFNIYYNDLVFSFAGCSLVLFPHSFTVGSIQDFSQHMCSCSWASVNPAVSLISPRPHRLKTMSRDRKRLHFGFLQVVVINW